MNDEFLSADTKAGRMRRAVFELWQTHQQQVMLPTSARFFYYELVAQGVISKTTKERTDGKKGRRSDQDLIEALTQLREAGLIPWDDIVDETRELTVWQSYSSVKDAMRDAWEGSSLNIWAPDNPPVIICRIAVIAWRS